MRYRVRGIHLSTGKETVLVVNAKHHEAAEAVARREMTVHEVVPEGGLAEPEDFVWERPRESGDKPDDLASAVANAAAREPRKPRRRSPVAERSTLVIVALIFVAALLWWWTTHR